MLDAAGLLPDLAASPLLAGLRGLTFMGDKKVGLADVRALSRSLYAGSLRVLDLSGQKVGNQAVQALGRSPHLGSLESLSLAHCFQLFAASGPEALDLRPLLESPLRDRLKALDVSGNGLLPDSWGALGSFPALAALMLPGIVPREITRFARSLSHTRLRLLAIRIGTGRVEWVRALASPLSLELSDLSLSGKSAEVIAGAPNAANLRELNLWANNLRDAGAEALARSPDLAGLVLLNLGCNKIGDAGAKSLAASPYLGSLRCLDVSGNKIGPTGRAALRARFGAGARCEDSDAEAAWSAAHYRHLFAEQGIVAFRG